MIQVLRTEAELRGALAAHWADGKLGFVPTMGALHEGHATLLRCAVAAHPTVLSVFVNPTQFGPGEDFSRYPRTFEADCDLAERAGVSYVFAPAPEVIYPPGWRTFIDVDEITGVWCGRFRPGHFRGVATVVHRLFQLVKPSRAYFGQKDLQQCLVVERMCLDLGIPVKIETVPTVRESDGMALSSRNRYLSDTERREATVIYRALEAAQEKLAGGQVEVEVLLAAAKAELAKVPAFAPQYVEIRALPNLSEIQRVEGPAALAIAGFLGKTRLIDNCILRS